MKYTVISTSRANADRALQELIAEVNRMIDTGWKPLGGVTYSQWGPLENAYSQAMIFQPMPKSENVAQ